MLLTILSVVFVFLIIVAMIILTFVTKARKDKRREYEANYEQRVKILEESLERLKRSRDQQ